MQLTSSKAILAKARECLKIEAEAILQTGKLLSQGFVEVVVAVEETIALHKKLIFTGVGKNVPVGLKLVGTFNSTGVPACFLDPNQALHGDLGLCQENDLVFLLSNSGETEDLLRLLPLLRRLGVRTVALCQNQASALVRACDYGLLYAVEREACPLNLAPTASTTAALALGDALAMVCLDRRAFSREDFARYHPAGSLGKSLLLRVSDIMRTGDRFACLPEHSTIREVLIAMTAAKCGSIALTSPDGRLAGVFTDGDFRRASLKDEYILQRKVLDYMTRHPKTVSSEAMAVDVLRTFESSFINDLIVVDADHRPVGLVDGQDLPKLKIV